MVTKRHTYLNKPAAFSCRFVLSTYNLLLPPGIKGLYSTDQCSLFILPRNIRKPIGAFTLSSLLSLKSLKRVNFIFFYLPLNWSITDTTHFLCGGAKSLSRLCAFFPWSSVLINFIISLHQKEAKYLNFNTFFHIFTRTLLASFYEFTPCLEFLNF